MVISVREFRLELASISTIGYILSLICFDNCSFDSITSRLDKLMIIDKIKQLKRAYGAYRIKSASS